MSEKFDARMHEWREQIDNFLKRIISTSNYPTEFREILEYSLFPGGKRLRPILFLEWHSLFAPPDESALLYACALELMHNFSLIHDDMPCVDNDDMRRGKPTVHKKYGEGKALLAGDALLDMAYYCMSDACCYRKNFKPSACFSLRGDKGIIHGQYLDLYSDCKTLDDLIGVYKKKTGSLITSACATGYLFAQDYDFNDHLNVLIGGITDDLGLDGIVDADLDERTKLIEGVYKFGEAFGIAFQLYDDLSEYIAGEKSDSARVTDFMELDKAKALLNRYLNSAAGQLDRGYNGDTSFLRELIEKFVIV